MGRFYAIICLTFCFLSLRGNAQTLDCEQTIALATEEFNAGHFYGVPALLNDCITSFSRDQRQRAFLLLTQTYLLLDDPIGAQNSFLQVLSANPEFIADEQLHAIDIVYLSKRFTATPKFGWFVGAGSNITPVRVIRDLEIATDVGEKNYSLRPGYNFGVGGEYSYNDNIRFRAELNFFQTAYRSATIDYFQSDIKTFTDRQTWLNLPLYVSYADNVGTYRPYVYAGYSFSRLFADKGFIILEKKDGVGEEMDTFEEQSPEFDFFERRRKMNQSLIFGAGLKYKIGLDFVFAEARYSAGLKNVVNPPFVYGNHTYDQTSGEWVLSTTPASGFAHIDDYMRLDNISVSIGFLRPLYKPRELKRARTKSVLRKMKRSK